MGTPSVSAIPSVTEAQAHRIRAKELLSGHRKLDSSDIPLLFTMPLTKEMQELDEFVTSCIYCGVRFELILDDHAINKAMAGCLLSHARSHQPGQPGARRMR